jgi:hypothetical protein
MEGRQAGFEPYKQDQVSRMYINQKTAVGQREQRGIMNLAKGLSYPNSSIRPKTGLNHFSATDTHRQRLDRFCKIETITKKTFLTYVPVLSVWVCGQRPP